MAHEVAWYDNRSTHLARPNTGGPPNSASRLCLNSTSASTRRNSRLPRGGSLPWHGRRAPFRPAHAHRLVALGILQLMPETARRVASKLNVPYSQERLVEPSYNIRLGTQYLKDMLGRFDNNYVLATAAYNAGPGKVREWLEMRPITEDWAHWVATIPYKETRQYVQNIMAFSKIYQAKLDDQQMIQASREIDGQATAIR
jgi:hypothetical protein